MKLYPAIDIKGGRCVRLSQGMWDKATDYGDPLEMAQRWEADGAYYLHVIDLDAAFSGNFTNKNVIADLVQSVKVPVQMGGGVRTKEDIKIRLDEVGISRVILGTVAVDDPDLLEWALSRYGDRIVVGIDAKNGKVAIKGWVDATDVDAADFAVKMRDKGVSTVIYTDITKDGMMQGPNLEQTERIVKSTWMNLIASGGVSTLEDIRNVKGTGASGCVIGTALYDGAFTLKEAELAAK
ncbi:1-(5-phosphoribosyl)-5-[(5-phosphoribosylamino)methylideneamino]imidazole-4-carboxamide isomerase [Christensenellaceae bacterium OttesenSCG-928-K19]|nr:1-(5-phosphoribosyl)-5-[(5-phosphoribosylamino)methylideneamino]imidazole-4-carboxamide isomerase [Christensenellaceae bacterium OttesenSCG-928-K19]